jgi:hypothetical protein
MAIDLAKELTSTHGQEIILPEHESQACNGVGQKQEVVGGLVRQHS